MNSRELYLRLLSYLRAYKGAFALSIVGMVITAASDLRFPALVQLFLYTLDNSYTLKFPQLQSYVPAWAIPLAVIALFVVRGLAVLLSTSCTSWGGNPL